MFKHTFPFDPTYGYDEARLLQIAPPPTPDDFVEFWRKSYAQTRATPLELSSRPSKFANDRYEAFDITFTGRGNFRCGAWLVYPRGTRPTRGIVSSHGYGGRQAPELCEQPGPPAAVIFPVARGMDISAAPGFPTTAAYHVIHGMESRDTYLHFGCVTDIWSAFSALLELVPSVEGKVDFMGGSFGGGIGAMALPWEERQFRKAYLACPSFGHHPLRLTMPCVGSGEAVRIYAQHHPEVAEKTLPYFDAAIAAQFIKTPTIVVPGLFDPAVPPPGQFAVYNALRAERALHIMPAAHFSWPDEHADFQILRARLAAWFA